MGREELEPGARDDDEVGRGEENFRGEHGGGAVLFLSLA